MLLLPVLLFVAHCFYDPPVLIEDEICVHEVPFIFHSFTEEECIHIPGFTPPSTPAVFRRGAEALTVNGNCNETDRKVCVNQGSWTNEYFFCDCHLFDNDDNGLCFSRGFSVQSFTCDPQPLGTNEMWIQLQRNTSDDQIAMEFSVLNLLFIVAFDPLIARRSLNEFSLYIVPYSGGDELIYEEAYQPDSDLLHVVVTLENSDNNCNSTHLKLYINNQTVVDEPEYEFLSYYHVIDEEYAFTQGFSYHNFEYIVDSWSSEFDPERVHMTASFNCVLDEPASGRNSTMSQFVERYQRFMAFEAPKQHKVVYARSIDIADYYRRHFHATPRTVFVSKTDHVTHDMWGLSRK